MNIVEAWDNFTTSDKQLFQNCCRKLLKRTFLVRDKKEDKKHYFFVANRLDIFSDYFTYMGFEVKCDKDSGVIMLNNSATIGEKEKLQSNRYRFSKEETIVLCCLWLVYMSRVKEGTLSCVIIITVSDLIYELEKYDARDTVNKSGLEKVFKTLKSYSLLDMDGRLGDIDCKLILYPSLQFVLDVQEFERFVKEVVEVVLAGKDNIGEDTDEQENDFE
ncbi:MAG: DUF4194 domain-containing protein [Clostridium sp.]|nr:DUF4194 domain-containing protein [Clostridium sp.]